jgi:hypothetical protein
VFHETERGKVHGFTEFLLLTVKVVDTLKDLSVDRIIIYFIEICCENMEWIHVAYNRDIRLDIHVYGYIYMVGSCKISGCVKCGILLVSSLYVCGCRQLTAAGNHKRM